MRPRSIALSLVLPVLAGFLPGCRGQSPTPSTHERAGSLQASEWQNLRGVIHCHGYLSHDSQGRHEEIIAAAQAVGLDFLMMTDHPSAKSLADGLRGKHGRTWFFTGVELKNLLGLDIRKPVQAESFADRVNEVLRQGGLPFVAHPEEFRQSDAEGTIGMEIYNIHADLKDEGLIELLARSAPMLLKHPEWLLTVLLDYPGKILRRWDKLGQSRRVVGIAGNDAHQNVQWRGITLDRYDRSFQFVQTHLFVKRPSGTDSGDLPYGPQDILEALRKGRAYVGFEVFADTNGFEFFAVAKDRIVAMGEEVPWSREGAEGTLEGAEGTDGIDLVARVPRPAKLRWIRDGKVIEELYLDKEKGATVRLRTSRPGVYRVELWIRAPIDPAKPARQRWWPWVLSNPVYLR